MYNCICSNLVSTGSYLSQERSCYAHYGSKILKLAYPLSGYNEKIAQGFRLYLLDWAYTGHHRHPEIFQRQWVTRLLDSDILESLLDNYESNHSLQLGGHTH